MYKSTPDFQGQKNGFLIILGKTNEIHIDRNFPKGQSFLPENVLKTRWIKKSRGLIICSEVYQDHNLSTFELFNLLEKYFYDIWEYIALYLATLDLNLDKKTKGTVKSFERLLDEDTAIFEYLITKLPIWGVLETKTTPSLKIFPVVPSFMAKQLSLHHFRHGYNQCHFILQRKLYKTYL